MAVDRGDGVLIAEPRRTATVTELPTRRRRYDPDEGSGPSVSIAGGFTPDQVDIIGQVIAEVRREVAEELKAELTRAAQSVRDECELTIASVRSELLAKIDDGHFGVALSDIDPRDIARDLRELRRRMEERLQEIGSSVGAMTKTLGASFTKDTAELRGLVAGLQQRINSGETLAARRADKTEVKSWQADTEAFILTSTTTSGQPGPVINLQPFFEEFERQTDQRI